jgi:RNA-directed DNA polymerase
MDLVAERIKDRKVLRLVSTFLRAGVVELQGGFAETLTGTPQGGVASPLLANIYLSVLDRHFSRIWDQEMTPRWRRQYRRRTGRPNFRLVRYADDFVVLVHGTRSEAEALKQEIGELLARRLKMTLSEEKTHITHIDAGFVFLGFHIQRRTWGGDGRRVVLTIPSKQALASVMHKIKSLTRRSTTSLSLEEVLRTVNPVLRGWAAYFRYGVSKKTFSYLGWYAWWRLIRWIRNKHPHLTWKQLRRRYYGADHITEGGLVLYNPAKMRVERYRFRGALISTPYKAADPRPSAAHRTRPRSRPRSTAERRERRRLLRRRPPRLAAWAQACRVLRGLTAGYPQAATRQAGSRAAACKRGSSHSIGQSSSDADGVVTPLAAPAQCSPPPSPATVQRAGGRDGVEHRS